jgi:hypothetical protein
MSRPAKINERQIKCKYWPAWRAAEKVLISAGHSKAETEEIRKEIHTAVTGSACSSKDLTNRLLDRVLAKFAAISAPSDGARQADLADGPCKRLRFAIREIQNRMKLADSYIEGMAASPLARRPLNQCDEAQLLDILKALTYHENRHPTQPLPQ